MRRIVLLALTVPLLASCGHNTGNTAKAASATTAASTTAAADPYDTYLHSDQAAGITPDVQRSEAVSVAGNTCDNTVTDMTGLVNLGHQLYDTPATYADYLTDRAYFIDAFCPSARVVYDAATQQAAATVVPPAQR